MLLLPIIIGVLAQCTRPCEAATTPATTESSLLAQATWEGLGTKSYYVQFKKYVDTLRQVDVRQDFGVYVQNDQIQHFLLAPSIPIIFNVMTIDGLFESINSNDGGGATVSSTAATSENAVTTNGMYDAMKGFPYGILQTEANDPTKVLLEIEIEYVLLFDSVILKELDQNRMLWQADGPTFYDMTFQNFHLFGSYQGSELHVSIARGFHVDSITIDQIGANGEMVAVDVMNEARDFVYSVDALFQEIGALLEVDGGDTVTPLSSSAISPSSIPTFVNITYDETLGYPSHVEIVTTALPSSENPMQETRFHVSVSSLQTNLTQPLLDARNRWDLIQDVGGLYGLRVRSATAESHNIGTVTIPIITTTTTTSELPINIVLVENDEIYDIQNTFGNEIPGYDYERDRTNLDWTAIFEERHFTILQLFDILASVNRHRFESRHSASSTNADAPTATTTTAAAILSIQASFDDLQYGIPTMVQIIYQRPNDDAPITFTHAIDRLLPYSITIGEIEAQEENVWSCMGMVNYNYVFEYMCFCDPDITEPRVVQIRNETVIQSVETVTTGRNAIDDTFPVVRTIVDTFQLLKQALQDGPHDYSISFDPIYGNPTSVEIVQVYDVTEDSLNFVIRDVTPIRDTELQTNLTNARKLWETFGLDKYRYAITERCFCEPPTIAKWVNVEGYQVVGTENVDLPCPDDPTTQQYDGMTIDEIFDFVQFHINIQTTDLVAEFDATYGYPFEVSTLQSDVVPDEGKSLTINRFVPYSFLEDQVRQQREEWTRQDVQSYSYVIIYTCECLHGGIPFEVTVVDGAIASTKQLNGNDEFTNAPIEFYTIEGLFEQIEKSIMEEADKIVVTYDDQMRFPTSISIDQTILISDEEFIATISNFMIAPTPSLSPTNPPTALPSQIPTSPSQSSSNDTTNTTTDTDGPSQSNRSSAMSISQHTTFARQWQTAIAGVSLLAMIALM